jgi:hypothetical protein
MPPQQHQRLLDLFDKGGDFSTHGGRCNGLAIGKQTIVIASEAKQLSTAAQLWIASSRRFSQ